VDPSSPPPRPVSRDTLATPPLPRHRPTTTERDPFAQAIPSTQAKPVLLIAVPDSFARGELHRQLHARYNLVEVDPTVDAVELARTIQPALIVVASGPEEYGQCALCDRIKADPALTHVPVLWITPAAGLPNVEDLQIAAEDTLTGLANNEALPIRVENLVEVRQYIQQGGLPVVKLDSEDSAARLADALFLDAVHRIVDDNIGNQVFGLEALARDAQVTLEHLEHRLLRLTRLSAAGFLRTKRIQRAIELLRSGRSIEQAAKETGFHGTNSFKRLFKQVVGHSPETFI
jgi:AraC-like DNA-binding protein